MEDKITLGDWEVPSKEDLNLYNKTTERGLNKINPFNLNEETIAEPKSQITEAFENLDKDIMQEDNLTSIDFNTRLTTFEIPAMVSLQMLNVLGVGGRECSLLARTIKRHKVSLNGMGRIEKVEMFKGDREHEEATRDTSLFGKFKGFMSGENAK